MRNVLAVRDFPPRSGLFATSATLLTFSDARRTVWPGPYVAHAVYVGRPLPDGAGAAIEARARFERSTSSRSASFVTPRRSAVRRARDVVATPGTKPNVGACASS